MGKSSVGIIEHAYTLLHYINNSRKHNFCLLKCATKTNTPWIFFPINDSRNIQNKSKILHILCAYLVVQENCNLVCLAYNKKEEVLFSYQYELWHVKSYTLHTVSIQNNICYNVPILTWNNSGHKSISRHSQLRVLCTQWNVQDSSPNHNTLLMAIPHLKGQ